MICRPIECNSLLVMQPQCRVQWSRAKLSEAVSTCRPCQPVKEMVEEEEGGGDKPIDRCNRSVWQLFSYHISFAASASSLRFVFLFTLFLILLLLFLCSLAFRFSVSVLFFFYFIFLADLVRRCDCRRGRSSAK